VDRDADLRELAPDIFAMHVLAGDLRVHRKDAITPVLEELHHAVGWPVRPIRRADDGDGPRAGQKLGDVRVAGERHAAITVQWTGVSSASSSLRAIAANASASGPSEAAGGRPASDA